MRSRVLLPAALLGSLVLATCSDSPTAVQEADSSSSAERIGAGGDLATTSTDPILVGAGDMHADCVRTGPEETALLLDEIAGTVFTLGDNTEHGTTADYESCYESTWGRHKARTKPIPGDNDYLVAGAGPYITYFGLSSTYYSYDVGGWHIIVLDSNIPSDQSSPQYQWLEADLAANPSDCAIAYWHHSRFSSTRVTNDTHMKPVVWRLLDSAGVDIVLSAHYHGYERFAPQDWEGVADPQGIRLFVVGTGGKLGSGAYDAIRPTSEVRDNSTLGVLQLTLHAASYSWEFVPVAGGTLTDSGTSSCVQTTGSTPGSPTADPGGPYSGKEGSTVQFDGSGSVGDGALTYDWDFGDGSTGTGSNPSHSYADDGSYTVTLVVTDQGGQTGTASTSVTISNVRPNGKFNAPSSVTTGAEFTLSFTNVTDPSSVDVTAGFTYRFDCGSGFGSWITEPSTTCPGFDTTGSKRVRGKVRDKDKGVRNKRKFIDVVAP